MKFFLFIFLLSQSLYANDLLNRCANLTGDKRCYHGEQITTFWDIPNVEWHECTGAGITVANECGDEKLSRKKQCRFGKVLGCRYCPEAGLTSKEIADKLNMFEPFIEGHCQALELTPKGATKLTMTPDFFRVVQSHSVERLRQVAEAIDEAAYMPNDRVLSNDEGKLHHWQKRVEGLMTGPGGLKESIDFFGDSKTISKLRCQIIQAQQYWDSLNGQIYFVKTPEQAHEWKSRLKKIAGIYYPMADFMEAKFIYNPEPSEPEDVPCETVRFEPINPR